MKLLLLIASILFLPNVVLAQAIDNTLIQAMKAYYVPVVGYAIINDGKISRVKTLSIDSNLKVSNQSLFQAASISKSMTAYAALKLVDKNRLKLADPANDFLTSWKIKKGPYNQSTPVLVQDLMDMTSGLSVSGFMGYRKGVNLPNNTELLNGEKPANNLPVKVIYQPGSKYFYSGGAFQVLQKIVSDTTHQPFASYMNHHVLQQVGMQSSIFEYPLKTPAFLKHAIPGFTGWDRKEIVGGWNNYAATGAGGMWSTPNDLAKFALNISASYNGQHGYISQVLAKQMLTRQSNTDFGYGVVVNGRGDGLYFWKAGHNYGYHSLVIMFPKVGKGMAIMTNSETGSLVIDLLVAMVAHQNHWPYYFPYFDELINIPQHT